MPPPPAQAHLSAADATYAALLRLPKFELHAHREGAIPAATLLALAQRHGVRLPVRTEAEVTD